jgi:hypothetical protein
MRNYSSKVIKLPHNDSKVSITSTQKISISDNGYLNSLAERYNTKDMKTKDFDKLANDLYSYGMITAFEKSAIIIHVLTDGTFNENAKHHFKAQWEYSSPFAQKSNNVSNPQIHQNVVNILNRLDQALHN